MAAAKKLQPDSRWSHLDRDGDGVVSDDEIAMEERMIQLEDLRSDMENEDKKQDAQRNMAWFALFGMLLYPFAVVLAIWLGLEPVSYTHLRAHETGRNLVCRLLLEKKPLDF